MKTRSRTKSGAGTEEEAKSEESAPSKQAPEEEAKAPESQPEPKTEDATNGNNQAAADVAPAKEPSQEDSSMKGETPSSAVDDSQEAKPQDAPATDETVTEAMDSTPAAPKEDGTEASTEAGAEADKMESSDAVPVPEPEPEIDSKWKEDERFKTLLGHGLGGRVADVIMELFEKDILTTEDMDERACEMLKGFKLESGLHIVTQLQTVSLIGVQNKASFLMAVMKNFKDRIRQLGSDQAMKQALVSGPDPEKLQAILDKTGYQMEVTMGQRKYGGPPPNWEGPAPSFSAREVYLGHIPKELFEDSLIPLFDEVGRIWDMRLMMDPITGVNRGYAFVTFCEPGIAKKAAEKYDGWEIKPGRKLKCNVSVANTRLFLGNIPKSKSKEEIITELQNLTEGLNDVILYVSPDATANRKNRGFCFADFMDHKSASDARRKLTNGKIRPWNCDLVVDWAESQDEPDDDTMSKVKVLYVRNLREAVTEEELTEKFKAYGELERVKKLRDYAFVHFAERDPAIKAMEELNNTELGGANISITLAKPQMDKAKRDKIKMERDKRQSYQIEALSGGGGGGRRGGGMGPGGSGSFMDFAGYPSRGGFGGGPPMRTPFGRPRPLGAPDYSFDSYADDSYYSGYGRSDPYRDGGFGAGFGGGYAVGYPSYGGAGSFPSYPGRMRGGGSRGGFGSRGGGGRGGRGSGGRGSGGSGGRGFSQKRKNDGQNSGAGSIAKRMNTNEGNSTNGSGGTEGVVGNDGGGSGGAGGGSQDDWAADVVPGF